MCFLVSLQLEEIWCVLCLQNSELSPFWCWSKSQPDLDPEKAKPFANPPKVHGSLSCICCKNILRGIFLFVWYSHKLTSKCFSAADALLRGSWGLRSVIFLNLREVQARWQTIFSSTVSTVLFSNSRHNHTCPDLATVPFSRWKLKTEVSCFSVLPGASFLLGTPLNMLETTKDRELAGIRLKWKQLLVV